MPMIHERIRLGISACLLGEPVRFDGGHKRDPFLVESLGPLVDWVPVCPEVASELDAPRESMRLVQTDGRIRLLTNKTTQDHTTRMHGYARRRVGELVDAALVGFVLKKDSPTCGLERVKVYGTAGMPVKSGRGLFADTLVRRFPLLPVEEEGRLNDPRLRENFVERVFAYRRLTALFATRWSIGTVVRFHTAHKLMHMAHRPEAYQRLGRLVASGKSIARREFRIVIRPNSWRRSRSSPRRAGRPTCCSTCWATSSRRSTATAGQNCSLSSSDGCCYVFNPEQRAHSAVHKIASQ
jgi:uncharacterized protein YbbK (DUF523 family)